MTILLLLAAQALAPTPAPASPPADDAITVLGERMRRLKLETKTDPGSGIRRCVFKRRSGDADFDARMCDAVLACAETVTTWPQMKACIAPHTEAYAALLRARRDQRAAR